MGETGMLVLELSCGHTEAVTGPSEDWLEETAEGVGWECSEGCDDAVVTGRSWRQHGVR